MILIFKLKRSVKIFIQLVSIKNDRNCIIYGQCSIIDVFCLVFSLCLSPLMCHSNVIKFVIRVTSFRIVSYQYPNFKDNAKRSRFDKRTTKLVTYKIFLIFSQIFFATSQFYDDGILFVIVFINRTITFLFILNIFGFIHLYKKKNHKQYSVLY